MGWAQAHPTSRHLTGIVGACVELKEFVAETLIQIVDGIEDAQRRLKEKNSEAIINTNMTETQDGHLVTGGRRRPVEFVEFDVAVLANESKEAKGGVGITVAWVFLFLLLVWTPE